MSISLWQQFVDQAASHTRDKLQNDAMANQCIFSGAVNAQRRRGCGNGIHRRRGVGGVMLAAFERTAADNQRRKADKIEPFTVQLLQDAKKIRIGNLSDVKSILDP